jgi:hypothetical protein
MGKKNIRYKQGELYETLVKEYDVFENLYDVLVFLAVVGYNEGRVKRTEHTGASDGLEKEAGLQNVYSRDLYRTIAACLAFKDTNDPAALVDESEHMRVLSQYSAGGLAVAEEEFGSVAGDPTDAVVSYIRDRHESAGIDEEDTLLGDIVRSFDDQMMTASGDDE